MNPIALSIVIIYLGIMLYIGWYSSKKIESNEDFMVAGRRLGPIMMAGTLAATEVGGGSSLGVVEKAYGEWGMSSIWYVLAMGVTFVILSFVAPKLRNSLVKTVPEYFRRRYGEAPGFITAIIMILPLIGLTAIQFIASAVVLSVMTGISYKTAVVIVAIIVTIYSVLGGLWSVTLTDFIQMFLIVGGMMLVVPFALNSAGGWSNVVSTLPAEKLSLTEGIGWKTIISLIVMYTASFAVGQEAVQRYYAAKDEKAAVKGSLIAAGVYLVFAFIPAILGLITFSMVQNGTIDATNIMTNGARYALPTLAVHTMPPVLVGLLFAGLISATMSSADSDLLGAGSIFANDIYKIYINKDADDKKVLRVTQYVMVVIGILSMIVALTNTNSIINVLMFSFTLRAGGAFFPYILGHYWKKASWIGTISSLLVGSIAVVLVEKNIVSFFGLDPIFPGLLFSLIVFVLFSTLYPNKSDSTELSSE
ncbi:sodium:solute symporter family protein [Alkalithermobacter paradoxus]|uniref:Sodium/proline symporter n=1 Tax=Alkalithermobacter paradoxus TaxID=29349 RepID=A0A1V4I5I0_9FIRM|nr:sodium/proline symporter [[Clostridium] thermoalcaliphilum]